jgi:hypothetical protein
MKAFIIFYLHAAKKAKKQASLRCTKGYSLMAAREIGEMLFDK